ncbi:MAG: transcriptional activator RfaH [Alphaproteobacteria bacterium]|jgi:transcriptional antiterminator RfaH|nr:transcriptional activator RfaH [Alphaproteobacteria bacterium]
MITWFVAHTHALKECVAKQHLLDQGYEVYLPRFKKIRRHARKVEEVLSPLFPRYIFLGIDLENASWRSVNGTRGVSYLLMTQDSVPARIPSRIIEELRSQEIDDGILPVASLSTFVRGERVRIMEGAFKDHVATYEVLDDKSRVHLLLTFMGREMQMTLPTYAVEAA